MGLLPDTQTCGLPMRWGCRQRFPRHLRVSDPYIHHGTCVTHAPWCMPGLLTSGFLWSRSRGKRSRRCTWFKIETLSTTRYTFSFWKFTARKGSVYSQLPHRFTKITASWQPLLDAQNPDIFSLDLLENILFHQTYAHRQFSMPIPIRTSLHFKRVHFLSWMVHYVLRHNKCAPSHTHTHIHIG